MPILYFYWYVYCSFFPVPFPTSCSFWFCPSPYLWCALVLQVANQSAVSQEQVDNILQENDALRTNLAALEQVIKQENSTPAKTGNVLWEHDIEP